MEIRIRKFPSNWMIFVTSDDIRGIIYADLDGLDVNDRKEREQEYEWLLAVQNTEELTQYMDKYDILWHTIYQVTI